MLHTTRDPGQQAWDIAEGEGDRVYRETGDARLSDEITVQTFQQALEELAGDPGQL